MGCDPENRVCEINMPTLALSPYFLVEGSTIEVQVV
jgi:hypothetical protein